MVLALSHCVVSLRVGSQHLNLTLTLGCELIFGIKFKPHIREKRADSKWSELVRNVEQEARWRWPAIFSADLKYLGVAGRPDGSGYLTSFQKVKRGVASTSIKEAQ